MALTRTGGEEAWTYGGLERPQRGDPVVLAGRVKTTTAANRYTTLRRQGAVAGYKVTAGKTLVLVATRWYQVSGNPFGLLGYGDTDVGVASVSAPAALVRLDDPGGVDTGSHTAPDAGVVYSESPFWEVPAGKYPVIYSNRATVEFYFYAVGVEV